MAIASRVGIDEVTAGIPNADGWTEDGAGFLAATCGGVRVASIYVPNGRMVDSEFYLEKLDWLARLSGWLDDTDSATELAICGDYNVAPTDDDVGRPGGGTARSSAERANARPWRSSRVGHGDVVRRFHPRLDSSRGGTTAPGTSTRTSSACASTTCMPRPHSPPGRCSGARS